jgi:hypothetical protein
MRFLTCLIGLLACTLANAEDRFYPTVDAQGRVQLIKSEQVQSVFDAEKTEKNIKDNKNQEAVFAPTAKQPVKVETSTNQGVRQLDSETYIDTELLERKNFNVEDKKRFYYVPSSGTSAQLVESDGSVVATTVMPETVKPMAHVSANYSLLSKDEILLAYKLSKECLNQTYIKKHSKPFKSVNNIWTSPSLGTEVIDIDGFLQLPTTEPIKQLRMTSFAATQKKSKFYVPVVVFLDDKGCVLSGAWQYWSRAQAGTETQYASVNGLVNIPKQSAYVLFYRPINTLKADIPLSTESGSFVVEAY